jgi:hypothetical protein
MLLKIIVIIFALGAFAGSLIIHKLMKDKPTPKVLVYIHGIFAGMGLSLLIIYISFKEDFSPILSFVIFIAAAFMGSILFVRDLLDKPGPKWLAVIHPIVALTALGLLAYTAFF